MTKSSQDLQHHLFLLTLNGALYLAPLGDLHGGIQNALDIGTGTGIWAIEFGLYSVFLHLQALVSNRQVQLMSFLLPT
jgi:hypothetical protein